MFLIALNNSILVLDFTAHSLQTAKPCEFTRSKAASLLLQATEQSLTSCEDLPVREQMKACTQLTAVFTTQCKTDGQDSDSTAIHHAQVCHLSHPLQVA